MCSNKCIFYIINCSCSFYNKSHSCEESERKAFLVDGLLTPSDTGVLAISVTRLCIWKPNTKSAANRSPS